MIIITKKQQLFALLDSNKPFLIIFTSSMNLIPQQSLLSFFYNYDLSRLVHEHIYIFNLVDQQVYEKFQIVNFPQITLMKGYTALYSNIGYNREKSIQAIQLLASEIGMGKYRKKLNIAKSKCKNNHQRKFNNQINQQKYKNKCFMCIQCKFLAHAEIDKPVLECQICDEILCYDCSHDNVVI